MPCLISVANTGPCSGDKFLVWSLIPSETRTSNCWADVIRVRYIYIYTHCMNICVCIYIYIYTYANMIYDVNTQ